MPEIKGSFTVKGTPLELDDVTRALGAVRMMFEKEFRGPLSAKSIVSMTGLMNMKLGSGAYVALEKIIGEIDGKFGSFSLHHSSSMSRGKPTQTIAIVPDSGTDDLAGIRGTMVIDIVEDDHFYTLNYELS